MGGRLVLCGSSGLICAISDCLLQDKVSDVAWSPVKSTLFATVALNGNVEIWDLSKSTAKPVVRHTFADKHFTTVQFSADGRRLLVGDDVGGVGVYEFGDSGVVGVEEGVKDASGVKRIFLCDILKKIVGNTDVQGDIMVRYSCF